MMAPPLPETPLDAACAFTALGWRVLPTIPGQKRPALNNWTETASNDLETVRTWYDGTGYGVGILTGPDTGIFVIDIDGTPGRESLAQLQNRHGKLPPTTESITGSGGTHLLYQCPPGFDPVTNRSVLGPGLDIRGTGGQILAPPTTHTNGTQYQWALARDPWTTPPAQPPQWLLDLVTRPEPPPPLEATPTHTPPTPTDRDDDLGWLTQKEHGDFKTLLQTDGWQPHHTQGNDTHYTRPGKNPRHGSSAVLHDTNVFVVFTTNAPPNLTTHGQRTTTGDGYKFNLFSYVTATRYNGDRSTAAKTIRNNQNPPTDLTPLNIVNNATHTPHTPLEEQEEPPPAQNRILQGIITGQDILNIPPPDPMIGDWLDKSMIFNLVGSYGSAKTFALIDMALSVTSGQEWLNQPIHHTGPVLYIAAEGGYTIATRAKAWLERHQQTQLPPNFNIYPDRLHLLDPETQHELQQAAHQLQPALIIIDTMAQSMPGHNENDSDVMSALYDFTDQLRKQTQAAVGYARHTGHNITGRGRGSSVFEDNADVVLSLTGQIKTGPVILKSEKQKGRANPDEMNVTISLTDNGLPYLRPTNQPPAGTEPLTEARRIIISKIRHRRTEKPRTKNSWLANCKGVSATILRVAFDDLTQDGYFKLHEGEIGKSGPNAAQYTATEKAFENE